MIYTRSAPTPECRARIRRLADEPKPNGSHSPIAIVGSDRVGSPVVTDLVGLTADALAKQMASARFRLIRQRRIRLTIRGSDPPLAPKTRQDLSPNSEITAAGPVAVSSRNQLE